MSTCPPRGSRRTQRAAWIVCVALVVSSSVAAGIEWRRVESAGRPVEPLVGVARSSHGDLALAAGGVVRWWRHGLPGAPERAALGDVRDLAFGPSGALWIGGGSGLWRWERDGRPERRPLRGDAGASDVARIVGGDAGLLVATSAGAYWSTTGRAFQPLAAGRVGAAVTQVAFRTGASPRSHVSPDTRAAAGAVAETRELWLFGDAGLERIFGLATASGLRVIGHHALPLPRPRSDASPIDLVVARDEGPLFVVYRDAIAVGDARDDTPDWRRVQPVLAPGAQARRLHWSADGLRLATDRGLFEAQSVADAWRRIGPEPGAQPCSDLDRDVALCQSGLHVRAPSGLPERSNAPVGAQAGFEDRARVRLRPPEPIPPDPPVAAIRSRALARAGLGVERDRALREGLARRGWWPDVGLQLGADYDRDERRFHDQAYVSGDHRRLFDRTRERATRFEALLELDWELGEIVYPQDSVDLSRELRQVLALRDDVSDEIHQLYFERDRIRARIAAGGPFEPGEETKLRVRARELAAGLDAWTGGWLSDWRLSQATSSPSPGPDSRGQPIE